MIGEEAWFSFGSIEEPAHGIELAEIKSENPYVMSFREFGEWNERD